MQLILIRHGESHHTVRDIASSEQGCLGLTDRGRGQADALRTRFASERRRVDVLLSSTADRARQTAEILRPALGTDTVVTDRDLCELRLGRGDGLPRADFEARYGSFDLVAAPDRPVCPDGESWNDFRNRVHTTLNTLATTYRGKTVAAVTHAGVIVVGFMTLFAIPRPGTGTRIDPDFASVTEWEHDDTTDNWRLIRFNDTAHLRYETT
ncbi:histidine phosphatase family protein [Saccharothrix syringae]|uniref:histidine phosphatase family protein n=1 Tax=Saccharothrix syringae TaxID=103733 RepID=UPI001476D318|nr:histidine phosphatase family protein [Saccharothrix syringae]